MRKSRYNKIAMTLPEVLTVLVVVVILTVVTIPAIDAFFGSMSSAGNVEAMISAALSSARAMAASEHTYVGIRFQKRCIFLSDYVPQSPDDPELFNEDNYNPLEAGQYLIFIIYDYDRTGLAGGFRAVEGLKPIKLPDTIGVMDLMYRTEIEPDKLSDDVPIDSDSELTKRNFNDATTFSIVFSPSGKMIIHDVRVSNRNGERRPSNTTESNDDIFNSPYNIIMNQTGMFIQDDYVDPDGDLPPNIMSFGNELSRRSFIIYDKNELKRAIYNGFPVEGYLSGLAPLYVSPYTGMLIRQGQ